MSSHGKDCITDRKTAHLPNEKARESRVKAVGQDSLSQSCQLQLVPELLPALLSCETGPAYRSDPESLLCIWFEIRHNKWLKIVRRVGENFHIYLPFTVGCVLVIQTISNSVVHVTQPTSTSGREYPPVFPPCAHVIIFTFAPVDDHMMQNDVTLLVRCAHAAQGNDIIICSV